MDWKLVLDANLFLSPVSNRKCSETREQSWISPLPSSGNCNGDDRLGRQLFRSSGGSLLR